jgi:choline dehydrogenase-like flavoprotein
MQMTDRTDKADYIIIGSGPAGCVLANRLSADPDVRVLLLEAGGSDRHPLFHMPAGFAKMTKGIASWGWSTVPQKHLAGRVLWYTQGKVIGGGSSINAQVYTRGNRRDYDGWGIPGWSYAEVLPYFKRAENNQRFANDFHGDRGLSAYQRFRRCRSAGLFPRRPGDGHSFNPDFNGAGQEGVGWYQLTQKDARRSSASVAYLKPIRGRRNLIVRTCAGDAHRRREEPPSHVEIVDKPGGQKTVLRRSRGDRFVQRHRLAEALMQSGIGPADHLKSVGVTPVHDLPGVGSNLRDHLDLFVIAECTGDYTHDNYAKLTALRGPVCNICC